MSYKILEQNGVENENIDGGEFNRFTSGCRDGIVQGVLRECELKSVGKKIVIYGGLILVCGIRIKVTGLTTLSLSDAVPARDTTYQIIVHVQRRGNDISADIFLREYASLVQEQLYSGPTATYQVELGTFTYLTSGSISDLIRSLEVISSPVPSASSINEGTVYGQTNVEYKTTVLGYSADSGVAHNVVVGYEAAADFFYNVAVGYMAKATDYYNVAIGSEAEAVARNAVQLGKGRNATPNTMQVFDKNIYDIEKNQITVSTVKANKGVYDGNARVYSANNPPPNSETNTSDQRAFIYINSIGTIMGSSRYTFNFKVEDLGKILQAGDVLEICNRPLKYRKYTDDLGNIVSQAKSWRLRVLCDYTLTETDIISILAGAGITLRIGELGDDWAEFNIRNIRLFHDDSYKYSSPAYLEHKVYRYARIVRKRYTDYGDLLPRQLLSNVAAFQYKYVIDKNAKFTIRLR